MLISNLILILSYSMLINVFAYLWAASVIPDAGVMPSFYFEPQYAYKQVNFGFESQYAYKRFCLLMCNVGDSWDWGYAKTQTYICMENVSSIFVRC